MVRISSIAGRYFVFDDEAAAHLRRHENINGVLVGTLPQQPTQNIFLGLPVEIRPEEAEALVRKGAAQVVDSVGAHDAALRSRDSSARKAYVESLKKQNHAAQKVLNERNVQKAAKTADRKSDAARKTMKQPEHLGAENLDKPKIQQDSSPNVEPITGAQVSVGLGVTPSSSTGLLGSVTTSPFGLNSIPGGPLCRFLQGAHFYMTPGLRFGAQYSVYPGDPLRFHAHFMANEYVWDEDIPVLDIVGGGRLATAVKKAYLIGGAESTKHTASGSVRTFSIEWAGM